MDGSSPATSRAAFDWNVWVGLSFESLGDGPHDFFCWQLVRAVLREAKGIHLPSFEEQKAEAMARQTNQLVTDHYGTYGFVPVPLSEVQPFDVLVFRTSAQRAHVGIVVGDGKFLHGGRNLDSCIERYTGMVWKNRLTKAYRHQR